MRHFCNGGHSLLVTSDRTAARSTVQISHINGSHRGSRFRPGRALIESKRVFNIRTRTANHSHLNISDQDPEATYTPAGESMASTISFVVTTALA